MLKIMYYLYLHVTSYIQVDDYKVGNARENNWLYFTQESSSNLQKIRQISQRELAKY